MNIKNYKELEAGKTYWYISVENKCHWKIRVIDDKFTTSNPESEWYDMIIFDNKKDADAFAECLQAKLKDYIIRVDI